MHSEAKATLGQHQHTHLMCDKGAHLHISPQAEVLVHAGLSKGCNFHSMVAGQIWAALAWTLTGEHLHPFWQGFAINTVSRGTHLEAPSGCLPQDLQANLLMS